MSNNPQAIPGDVLMQLMPWYYVSTNTTVSSWRHTIALVQVQYPDCHSTDVVQYGKQANGTQHYHCHNRDCPRTIVLLQYQDTGRLPAVSGGGPIVVILIQARTQ